MKLLTRWILLANSSYAEIFELRGKQLELVDRHEHIEGRKRARELVTDRPGRTFAIASTERHSLGEEEDRIRRHEHSVFIHELTNICVKAKNNHSFDRLVLIAPPQFLGEMREIFKKHALDPYIDREIVKDLPSYLSVNEKREILRDYLDLPA